MYIVFEAIASNDPRMHPEMVRLIDFLNYTIYDIPENIVSELDIEGLNAELLSENVGRASLFFGAVEGKVQVKANTTQSNILLDNESGKPQEKKVYYAISEQEEADCVTFIKTVLKNMAEKYIQSSKQRKMYIAELENCTTIDECNWFMWHYNGITHYNTYGDRAPKFEIEWSGP